MQKKDNQDAGPSALLGSQSNSDQDTSSGEFPPSAKLSDKLNQLANWRLDLSSIEFVKDAPKSHGAFATVSRALLVASSSGQDGMNQANPTEKDGLGSPGPPAEASRQRKDVAVRKMNMSDDPARVLGLALREAEFLVGLSHENIIELEGFVENLSNGKDVVWLVFPWAENGNLKNFITSAEWGIPERIYLIYDVVRGVEYLHSQQPPIGHGDLKSINILVNSECRAVITDFGSAHHQTTEDLDEETSRSESKSPPALSLEPAFCSATNTMIITLKRDHYSTRWAAPELLKEEKATLASDIWALGCVVYEVMTNSIPFRDVINDNAVIVRVVKGDCPSITDNDRMSLIQALCSLVLACWSIEPCKRQTAENCRKLINWMPMIKPDPRRITDAAAYRARSSSLLVNLGSMRIRQDDYPSALGFFNDALCSYGDVGDRQGRADALWGLAEVHRLQNEYSQAMAFYSQALQIHTDVGDRQGRADALLSLAEMHRLQNEYSQAMAFYSEALQIHTDMGDKKGRADALRGLAEVYRLRNEYNQAVTFYTEARQIHTDIGDRKGRADALRGLADVHRVRGEYSQAVILYTKALQHIGSKQGRADAHWGLAQVHQARNEYTHAITSYTEAFQIRTKIGNKPGTAEALLGLAEVHRLQNEPSQAITIFSEALQIYTDIGDKQGRAEALSGLAEVHHLRSEYNQAVASYSEALEIFTDIGDRKGRASVLSRLADVHRLRDEYSEAVAFYTEAIQIRTDIGDKQGRANALWGLAEVHRLRTEYSRAVTFYSESLDIRTDIADRQGRAMTLRSLARVYQSQKKYSQAIELLSEALEICTGLEDRSGRTYCLLCLRDVHRDQGNNGDAAGSHAGAAAVFEQIGEEAPWWSLVGIRESARSLFVSIFRFI